MRKPATAEQKGKKLVKGEALRKRRLKAKTEKEAQIFANRGETSRRFALDGTHQKKKKAKKELEESHSTTQDAAKEKIL